MRFTLIPLLFVLLLLVYAEAQSQEITMNLAFSLDGKTGDVAETGSNYSLIYDTTEGVVVGIISLEQATNTSKDILYSPTTSMVSVSQQGGTFLIVVTNGSNSDISGSVTGGKIHPSVFGVPIRAPDDTVPVHLVAHYTDVDLGNDTTFSGPSEMIVRNNGKTDGISNITIGRVR